LPFFVGISTLPAAAPCRFGCEMLTRGHRRVKSFAAFAATIPLEPLPAIDWLPKRSAEGNPNVLTSADRTL
jgi:hypothetical protein